MDFSGFSVRKIMFVNGWDSVHAESSQTGLMRRKDVLQTEWLRE
jgi:hypothetical protein